MVSFESDSVWRNVCLCIFVLFQRVHLGMLLLRLPFPQSNLYISSCRSDLNTFYWSICSAFRYACWILRRKDLQSTSVTTAQSAPDPTKSPAANKPLQTLEESFQFITKSKPVSKADSGFESTALIPLVDTMSKNLDDSTR